MLVRMGGAAAVVRAAHAAMMPTKVVRLSTKRLKVLRHDLADGKSDSIGNGLDRAFDDCSLRVSNGG